MVTLPPADEGCRAGRQTSVPRWWECPACSVRMDVFYSAGGPAIVRSGNARRD